MNKRVVGKLDSFTEAYNNYYSVLYNTVSTKVNNVHECEDICQEIFMIFYQKMESIENPRAWLVGTMRNVVMGYYRDKGRSHEDIEAILDDSSMGYVNGFRDARIIIEDTMNNPEIFDDQKERALFDLVALYNYSYNEAAKHMSMSYRQVRYSFQKSSKRIVEKLRAKGINGLEELL